MKNREIKFRAYTSGNFGDHWCYGYLFRHPSGIPSIFNPNEGSLCVNEESIGQFTGLKDKNGVEIYEWDIVKVDNYNMYPKKAKVIQWDNDLSSYVFKSDNVTPVRLPMAIGITVIGNIYEHPHLLTPQS